MTQTRIPSRRVLSSKISGPMIIALRDIRNGTPTRSLSTRSHWGGREQTIRALQKRGLLDPDEQITAAGIQFLDSLNIANRSF